MREKIDLSGRIFGNWIVTDIFEYRESKFNKRYYWKCICKCGVARFVVSSSLMSGHSTGCGCERPWKRIGNSSQKSIFGSYKRTAKIRNLDFNLTFDEFLALTSQSCFYCGAEPANKCEKLYDTFIYNGIDRKNNDIGYFKENCVTCCKKCNYVKSDLGFVTFLNYINKIHNNTKNKVSYLEKIKYLKNENLSYFKKFESIGLDLGCGDRREFWTKNYIGLDMFPYGQDIVHNLCDTPWPIEDNQFLEIKANHILEHIKDGEDFINILNEVARVAKPGAIFRGEFPRFPTSPNWYRDPTHCRMTNEFSFDLFLENTPIHVGDGYGIKAKFRPLGQGISRNSNDDIFWTLEVVK